MQAQTHPKPHIVLAILLGIWLTAFLVFVGPYDTAELPLQWRAQVMYGYGLVIMLSYWILIPVQKLLFRLLRGNIYGYEVLINGLIISLGLLGSFWYYETPKINGDYGFARFTLEIFLPTNVIFVPLLLTGRWWINARYKPPKSKKTVASEKQKADELLPKVKAAMDNKVYLDPELNLQDFAACLNVNTKSLSQSINLSFGQNFNDFINDYRVDEIIKAIDDGAHGKHTLQGIAENCGFKSKATFNRAFRKKMNTSPSEYIKSLADNGSKQ